MTQSRQYLQGPSEDCVAGVICYVVPVAQNEKLQSGGISWLAQGHWASGEKDNSLTRAIQKALNLLKGKDVGIPCSVLAIPRIH